MHPLHLYAKPGNWRIFTARKADPAFRAFAEKIHQRDQHTCQFCGFQAKVYQEIVNLDNNYYNNKKENLVTACCFCAQCFFIDAVGKNDYGGGSIIYLPEMTQAELNAMCHVLFCAMANETAYNSAAKSIYRAFRFRTQAVDEQFGSGVSRANQFGQLLIESGLADQDTKAAMDKLRLLPSQTKFRTQIEAWGKEALAQSAS
jgi:intracellular multiplication protein IcmJ